MMKKPFVLFMLSVLLFSCLGAAGAEEADAATPTDLDCVHEHVREVVYFYDSPAYTYLSTVSHRVSGPAEVQTVCRDCGKVLSSETVRNAEEIRSHSIRKGVCALCGYRPRLPDDLPEDLPGERTLFALEGEEPEDPLSLTLTRADMTALENAQIVTALVRGEAGEAAVALELAPLLDCMREAESDLYIELAEREDLSFYASVSLLPASGERTEPECEGISLRFRREQQPDLRFSFALPDGGEMIDAPGVWDDNGFWTVEYLGAGDYFALPRDA